MSRYRRTAIFCLGSLAVALLCILDNGLLRGRPKSGPKTEAKAKAYDLQKYHAKTFRVTNVLDGDTLEIDIPDANYNHTRIRLWGIDTPETKHPDFGVMYFGPQAAEFAKQLTFGKKVTVYLDETRTRGYYGRLLAYVLLPDDRFLNEVLVAEGFAYSDLRFDHGFYNTYKQLEAGARSAKKGLWENVTREQLPQWLQRKKPTLLLKK